MIRSVNFDWFLVSIYQYIFYALYNGYIITNFLHPKYIFISDLSYPNYSTMNMNRVRESDLGMLDDRWMKQPKNYKKQKRGHTDKLTQTTQTRQRFEVFSLEKLWTLH